MSEGPPDLSAALSDRYTIERELGRGGMATVYLAQDLRHERHVALKVLHPEIAQAIGPERFLREMKITARLTHPHILPLLDSGEAEGVLYYTMPFVEGESLRERLGRDRQLPVEDALRLAAEIADALGSAHRHNVIHRDIKPENILIEEGHAVVADFGIARAISEVGTEQLTETGMSVGTPSYMSPEQVSGERSIDGRSDVYALGCVLYEMLAGQVPFIGPSVESVVRQHLIEEPRSVLQIRSAVPDTVAATLQRSLAKNPADRQPSADAFAAELRAEAATIVSGSSETATATPYPYHTFGAIVGSLLVLLAAIYGLVIFFGLPDWVIAMAAVIAVAGSPVLIFTGHVERHRTAKIPIKTGGALGKVRGWVSWRRFLLGAAVAFAMLGFVTAAYMASRVLGVGPAATLLAQGVLGERDALVLADFEDFTGDAGLARALTEAVRTDLNQSPVVTLISHADVGEALSRMERPGDTPLRLPVALEVAQREGLKAVVAGEVHAAGTGYVLSASVVAAESNEVMAAARATARDSTEVLDAIDQISAKIRERVGESLRTIRRSPELSQVTTASLPALRRYSDALVVSDAGDDDRAMVLLEEAVEIDTAFAMAYRKLGIIMSNRRVARARQLEMFKKAYEHRDRLTERERYLAMATYETYVTGDVDKAIQAYEALLRLDPNDAWALNNLGVQYSGRRDYVRAAQAYARSFELDRQGRLHLTNLAGAIFSQGDSIAADSLVEVAHRLFPTDPEVADLDASLAFARHEYDRGLAILDSLHAATRSPYWRDFRTYLFGAFAHAARGRAEDFREYFARAMAFLERTGGNGNALLLSGAAAGFEATALGAREDAIARLESVLERIPLGSLEPADRPYWSLAIGYSSTGRLERAKELLAEADRELDQGLKRRNAAGIHRASGYVALAEGRVDDAVTEFRRSDAELGCPICALHGLGTAYRQAGEPDSAIAVFERFVNTPYSSRLVWDALWLPGVYQHLGELHEERGDREDAVRYLNRFVELWTDADPELQPRVDEIRQRIARLVGEPLGTTQP